MTPRTSMTPARTARPQATLAAANAARLPLADGSIDMVFADPPYVADLVHVYRYVANEAARVLKPGAFVAVMCGGNNLNRIMRWFDDAGLDFYWLYHLGLSGRPAGIVWKHGNRNKPIAIRTKNVLIYSKGKALARTATAGLYWAGRADKRWHHWGQDIDSHRYYIDCFSAPGDLVVDPCIGGGTTSAACQLLGRRWVGFDTDMDALITTRYRMSGDGDEDYDPLPLFANGGTR